MNCPNCGKPAKAFDNGFQCLYCGLEEYQDMGETSQ